MSILEKAKRDIARITSNTKEFAVPATIVAPSGETSQISLLHTKHHLGFDAELQKWANVKNAHVSFMENLLDAGYPVRDVKGEVFLKNHKIYVKDSTGQTIKYNIDQWFPDETVGLITVIIGANVQ